MDYYTNLPKPCKIYVSGFNKREHDLVSLGNLETKSDGSFNANVNAVKSAKYHMFIIGNDSNRVTKQLKFVTAFSFEMKDNGTKDLGLFFETSHAFYCKLAINKTTSDEYDFMVGSTTFSSLPLGSTRSLIISDEISRDDFFKNDSQFVFRYKLIAHPTLQNSSTTSKDYQISIKIPKFKDTTEVVINY